MAINDEKANTVTVQYDWAALVAAQEDLNKPDPTYLFSRKTYYQRPEDSGLYQDDE